MKNIWFICKYATSKKYSFDTRHFELSKEWVINSYDVTIFSSNKHHLVINGYPKFKGPYFKEKIDGISTIWIKVINYSKSFSLKRIISWVQFEIGLLFLDKKEIKKPDTIIISSLSIFSILTGIFYKNKYNAKLIIEIRDIWPLSIIEIKKYSKHNLFIILLSYIEKIGYKKANVIVGTMPNLKEHVKNVSGSNSKCVTIPQGINRHYINRFTKLNQKYINDYIPKDKFIFAYTGTLNVNNPINIFLDQAKYLTDTNAHFLIIGNGDKKKELIQQYNHYNNISFPPYVHKNQVNHLLSFSSVCFDSLIPGIGKYGISRNKWIDYMIASKPIICCFSGYQSMINEAECGEFINYNDKNKLINSLLRFLIMDKKELNKIGNNGKKFILENRTFDKLAYKYESYL